MTRVIGIDLGTTNSAVAVMEGGTAVVIPNREGARTTPSIVAFTRHGETLVGQIAKRQALTNPENTIYGAKRLVGRAYDSEAVRAASRMSPYRIVRAPNGDAHVEVLERVVSPPEIEAIVLQKLKEAAEDYLGETVDRAIISVPAYFNDAQRQATRDAGRIAGLTVDRILNESTAAALAYGVQEPRCGTVAVYDLGGGTFDISILELQDGIFEVLATVGDTYLGGEDFDELIVRWLIEEFHTQHGIDVSGDPMARQRLKEAAEKTKCELSTQPQAEIALPFLSADEIGPKHLLSHLTRSRFETMIAPMLEHTAALCRTALDDAGVKASDIDVVVPVGGQTRTPAVFHTIERIFQKEPIRSVNPDEIVAIGTAIQTGILHGDVTDVVLLDVTPHTLGIETKDGASTPIIERNSNIPTKICRVVSTTVDHQPYAKVHVLQGESPRAEENTSLARFRFGPIPPAPAGRPQIGVTFEIDVNGILQVEARDRVTGREHHEIVRTSGGLTAKEIEAARERITRNEDGWRLANLDERLRQALLSARQALERSRSKLDREETALVERTIRWAGSVLNTSSELVEGALLEMDDVLQRLARALLRPDDPSSEPE